MWGVPAGPTEEGKPMFRTLIIAATTAATLFSSVAFTQEASQGTTVVADFSGMWAYPYWPSFAIIGSRTRREQVAPKATVGR
jgi:hypothetical protein